MNAKRKKRTTKKGRAHGEITDYDSNTLFALETFDAACQAADSMRSSTHDADSAKAIIPK